MNSIRLSTLVLCVLTLVSGCVSTHSPRTENRGRKAFTLVKEGKAGCTLITAEPAAPAARLAALELQFHVLKSTGVELPIRTDQDAVAGPRILVGESAATRALGLKSSDFAPQEYLIAFRPDTIVLMGRDWQDTEANRAELGRPMSCGDALDVTRHRIDYWKTVGLPERSTGEMALPGIYDDQATCYATYDFLERYCGVRWYGASAPSIVIPAQQTLAAKGSDIRRAPALKLRDALWGGHWPFVQGQWGPVTQPEMNLFWRRMRLGGEKWAANHTFHKKTIETMLTDPEYQAQGPGRGTQLCYSSPKLVEEIAQMARDYFDGKKNPPEGWKAAGDYFALVPDDNMKLCTCERCQALLDSGKDMVTGQFSSGTMSNYFFSFVNAVAREVRETHPDKYIATLAYWNYALPPRGFDLEPNVSIAPCLHTCMYAIHPEMRDNDMKLYKEWLQKTKAPVFLWNYYHHPMEPALIDKFKCFPLVMPHESVRTARMFIHDGVRGIFICGQQDMLENYLIAKTWDNPDLDVDATINEFFSRYFGHAAAPMKKFYLGLEKVSANPKNYPRPYYKKNGIDWKHVAWTALGTQARMQQFGEWMAQAEAQARTPEEKQRVALWRDGIWKWMQEGRAQYEAAH